MKPQANTLPHSRTTVLLLNTIEQCTTQVNMGHKMREAFT